MSRRNISYKHIVDNIIKILQSTEKKNDEDVHSYEEWLELLQGDLVDNLDEVV